MKLRMDARLVLFFCFSSEALRDGDPGTPRYVRGTEGGSIRVGCSFQFADLGRKFFCKEQCKREHVLVQTNAFEAQNGRYSLRYGKDSGLLNVSIAQLTKSDAGRYRCRVRRRFFPDSFHDFEVIVTDGSNTFPEAKEQQAGFLPALVVCVTVLVVVLLAAVLLLLYKRKRKDSGSNKGGSSDCTGTENCPPPSTHEDSTYQSLDPDSRDPDPIYCALRQIQHR